MQGILSQSVKNRSLKRSGEDKRRVLIPACGKERNNNHAKVTAEEKTDSKPNPKHTVASFVYKS